MNEEHVEILLGIQKEVSTNTESLKNVKDEIKGEIVALKKQVTFTNGKVRLHSKILLVVGAVLATLLVTSGNERVIEIFKLFI
jgi:hypothetical protein